MKFAYIFFSVLALSSLAHARGHYEETECDAINAKGHFHLHINDDYAPEQKSSLTLISSAGKTLYTAFNDFDQNDQFVITGNQTNVKSQESEDESYRYTHETYDQEGTIHSMSAEASKGLGLVVGDVLQLTCVHDTTQR
jgi:hypothetical protein